MKVLVCCEYSGIVRNAFSSAGHNAWSVDLLSSVSPGKHVIGNCLDLLYSQHWDLVIAHPPCTYLTKAQLFRCVPGSHYEFLQQQALQLFLDIFTSPPEHIAIENPSGALTRLFRPPDQIVQPWHFGNSHRKEIALWLKNLPPLISTLYNTKRRPMSNHTNSRMTQHQRSQIRSLFFPEVAQAMATQWTEKYILG